MKYKSWQKYPIEYLTNKCINRDGILLYHFMGSGKTFTSLGIALNLGNRIVLVAPTGLLNQWKSDYFEKFTTLPEIITSESYETIWKYLDKTEEKELQNYTLIMDESHNISD